MQRVVLNLHFIYCMGWKLLVAFGSACGIRFIYYELHPLDMVEKHEEQIAVECNGMGGCHCFCFSGSVLYQYISIPELPDSIFFA